MTSSALVTLGSCSIRGVTVAAHLRPVNVELCTAIIPPVCLLAAGLSTLPYAPPRFHPRSFRLVQAILSLAITGSTMNTQ